MEKREAISKFALKRPESVGVYGYGSGVFKQSNILNIAVEVGLVVGITAATTPIGHAIFSTPAASSDSITPQVFVSLYLL